MPRRHSRNVKNQQRGQQGGRRPQGGQHRHGTPRDDARSSHGRQQHGARHGAPSSGGGREQRSEERRIGDRVLGTLTRHRDGYGFVAPIDRKGDDVFVPAMEAVRALSGDLVRVEVSPGLHGRTAGRHLEVVERRRRWVLGTYFPRGKSSFVVPADRELEEILHVKESREAEEGELVKVALAPGGRLEGEVVERVGRPGEPKVEVLKVAYGKGFSDLFPDDVAAAAQQVPDHVTPEDRAGRRDLTDLPLVTIDGADARDFDDAVYVERLHGRAGRGRGYRLVVAIADVSHYVTEGSALDEEALRRGTSVYFPDQVLPMLPERLSNGICSLNPNVDRLCMVADIQLDARGRPVATDIYEGVMRSHARCTYEEVARVIAGETVPGRERFRDQFMLMAELQEKLGAIRRGRGAIDLDLPEAKIVLGEGGKPVAIERRPRNRAHRVIEEFMLAANEAVARSFGEQELPTIYRVHGLPDEEKLEAFRTLAETQGFQVPEGPIGPKQLNALLESFRGHAQERALSQLLLRAMMQALYSPENIGHFGLAAEHYLHFTSPIRRYPDLIVHRLLKQAAAARDGAGDGDGEARGRRSRRRRRGQGESAPVGRDLEEIAALASERERAAMQAEREIASFYAALFMKEHVGARFAGVVASVVEFGLFVELKDHFVEGLVKVEDLGVGLHLDPRLHALVDRARGRAFRVGDEVEVEVLNASPARRQIDLALVEGGRALRAARDGLRPDRGAPRDRSVQRGSEAGEQGRHAGPEEFARGGRKGARGSLREQKQLRKKGRKGR